MLLTIGISGVTCGGKTTLANQLHQYFKGSKLISQDDYFLEVDDPRHIWIPELDHINFDILSSLDMEKMNDDINNFIKNKQIMKIGHTNFQQKQTIEDLKLSLCEKIKNMNLEILIVEGFSIFNYKPFQNIFHLKYYFTLPKEECFQRRNQRVYEPPDCPGYFELCVWPEHEKQLKQVQQEIKNVRYFDGHSNNAFEEVLTDIYNLCNLKK